MIREFFNDWKRWTLKTAWHNFRWNLGYKIGGFTSAYKRRS